MAEEEEEKGYTGLIVVAKGLGLKRSQSPAIKTPDGRSIFGRESRYPIGELSYYPDVGSAKSSGKAGPRPLIVYATGRPDDDPKFKRDMIIPQDAADMVLEANKIGRFLEKGRVIIVH